MLKRQLEKTWVACSSIGGLLADICLKRHGEATSWIRTMGLRAPHDLMGSHRAQRGPTGTDLLEKAWVGHVLGPHRTQRGPTGTLLVRYWYVNGTLMVR